MKPQFQHQITTSFALWFDNYLLKKGEAFKNYTTNLTYLEDARLMNDFVGFSSPYKQWVYDESITGATIPNNIILDGTERLRKPPDPQYPFFFDWQNGRVLLPDHNQASTVSATYAVKDFNTYITNETEENLIIESKFEVNSRFKAEEIPIPPYAHVTPAIFINNARNFNDPFSFGPE